jgi:hypothetical protein
MPTGAVDVCSPGKNGSCAPPVVIKLTETRRITTYKWAHTSEMDRQGERSR